MKIKNVVKLNSPVSVKKIDLFRSNDTLKRGDIKLIKVWYWRYLKHIIFFVYEEDGKLQVHSIDEIRNRKSTFGANS
jgi:hypothetical protein